MEHSKKCKYAEFERVIIGTAIAILSSILILHVLGARYTSTVRT